MKMLWPLLFAGVAAVGNALFAAGQKKAAGLNNPFASITLAALFCLVLMFAAAPLFGPANYISCLKTNWAWVAISGAGLFLTYVGFNLLYSHYGTSYYILYAVLSILTTAIIVGAVFFKESFNLYHWLAAAACIVTVVLFTLGNRVGKA